MTLAGGSQLPHPASVKQRLDPPAESLAYQSDLAALARLAAAGAADRGHRPPGPPGGGGVSRGEQARVKPAPEPEPEPEPGRFDETEPSGPAPDGCGDYAGNRALGCAMVLDAGLSLEQMSCLDSLWARESGWDHRAENPSSGAYGIPQALPGDKMASHGSDWRTDPATQIAWGLDYIGNRYGTPCDAWRFWQANNWY